MEKQRCRPAYRRRNERGGETPAHRARAQKGLDDSEESVLQSGARSEGGPFVAPQVAAIENASRQGDAVEASGPLGVRDEQDGHDERSAAWAMPQRDNGDTPVFQIAGVRAQCRLLPREVWAYALATEGAYNEGADSLRIAMRRLQEVDPNAIEVRREAREERTRGTPATRQLDDGEPSTGSWNERDGLLHYGERIYVPIGDNARTEVLSRNHDDPLAGHF
ncbi:MAG: hypothetical protein M1823_007147, partial [Watsoniomyces obsoletus]